MAQSHRMFENLPVGKETSVFWALDPDRVLVVFVHGFNGSPTGTWDDFSELLLADATFSRCDLIFYGYDSLYKQVPINGALFKEALASLATQPFDLYAKSVGDQSRGSSFQYKKIVLVAHSLGAVVVRRALLDAHREGAGWLNRVQMLLFAPAHMGATNIRSFAGEALAAIPGIGRILSSLSNWRFRVLEDLAPDSTTLENLRLHTVQALASGRRDYLVAQRVIFGEEDNVVQTASFCDDPPLTPIRKKTHSSVCKPSNRYLAPVEYLKAVL